MRGEGSGLPEVDEEDGHCGHPRGPGTTGYGAERGVSLFRAEDQIKAWGIKEGGAQVSAAGRRHDWAPYITCR